ncbi:MAG: AAA family ATPase [Salinibacterium sp.]|nr:AAA family ATPase [Salinibacterium sp.]MBF0671776.1 AAA family ATPase [Salinibacterium sp.]
MDDLEAVVAEATEALLLFKNVVLEGPPGTGKTFARDRIAEGWKGRTGRDVVTAGTISTGGASREFPYSITLHPSTTYEEFVEGLRYDDSPKVKRFVLRPGFIRLIVEEAKKDPDRDYLVLIDELNRANVPKVLGDLLLTVEASKRSHYRSGKWQGGTPVMLPYSGTSFDMPSNVYLLGTMNSSDRSIAPLDAALRRRFAFVRVNPLGGGLLQAALATEYGTDTDATEEIWGASVRALDALNEVLVACLGPDSRLGHSYLFVDPEELLDSVDTDVFGSAYWVVGTGRASTGSQFQFPGGTWNVSLLPELGFARAQDVPTRQGTAGEVASIFKGVAYRPALTRNLTMIRLSQNGPVGKSLPVKDLESGVVVFRPLASKRVVISVHPLDRAAALWDASDPAMRSAGAKDWGVIHGQEKPRDLLWRVWRYGILPQLIETAAQGYAIDLLIGDAKRSKWLADASFTADERAELEAAWGIVDAFLASDLGVRIVEDGRGLTRGVSVVESKSNTATIQPPPPPPPQPPPVPADAGFDADPPVSGTQAE